MRLEKISIYDHLALSVNGYGAPEDPINDGNLQRYLGGLFSTLDAHRLSGRIDVIYLCGGRTNRPDLSEAEALKRWIVHYEPRFTTRVHLLDTTISAKENVRAFAHEVANVGLHPLLACEYSRWPTMEILARSFFMDPVTVLPIKFDAKSLRPKHQLKQLLVHAPVEFLSLKSGMVDAWRHKRRMEVIDRAQREYLQKSSVR